MNLRDVHGRLVASGQTPTIMITDDHKTSGGKGTSQAASMTGTTTDTGILSASTAASVRARTKTTREPSASTEEERRARKAKPYDRKSVAPAPIPTPAGLVSPRSYPHGLSMTPLNGRSIPGSPAAERNSYFTLPLPGVQPGSGAVSPSLLMSGNGEPEQPSRSVPNSPLGISDALPAISQRLSDWAAESSWQVQSVQQQQMQYAGLYQGAQPTGLALNMPNTQAETLMQMDDENSWAYASSEGGISQHPGSSSFSQDAFSFASPRSSLHGQENRYGYHSGTSATGASDISVNNNLQVRFSAACMARADPVRRRYVSTRNRISKPCSTSRRKIRPWICQWMERVRRRILPRPIRIRASVGRLNRMPGTRSEKDLRAPRLRDWCRWKDRHMAESR
jgi:hypothetical protein